MFFFLLCALLFFFLQLGNQGFWHLPTAIHQCRQAVVSDHPNVHHACSLEVLVFNKWRILQTMMMTHSPIAMAHSGWIPVKDKHTRSKWCIALGSS